MLPAGRPWSPEPATVEPHRAPIETRRFITPPASLHRAAASPTPSGVRRHIEEEAHPKRDASQAGPTAVVFAGYIEVASILVDSQLSKSPPPRIPPQRARNAATAGGDPAPIQCEDSELPPPTPCIPMPGRREPTCVRPTSGQAPPLASVATRCRTDCVASPAAAEPAVSRSGGDLERAPYAGRPYGDEPELRHAMLEVGSRRSRLPSLVWRHRSCRAHLLRVA